MKESKQLWKTVPPESILIILLGGNPEGVDFLDMIRIWNIEEKCIAKIYLNTERSWISDDC